MRALRALLLALAALCAQATCPVSQAQDFSGAVSPCSNVANACTSCLTALATPFVIAGVSASNSAALGECINSQAATAISAGVNPVALGALSSCSLSPPPPAAPTCPVSTTQNFAAAVSPCASTANACTTCLTALATPFVIAGVSPTDSVTLGVCINAQAAAILTAGVNAASLGALSSCSVSPPPPALMPPTVMPPPAVMPPPPATCPVSTTQNFASAVSPCSNTANVCTTCVTALATPFILAGVSPSNMVIISACIISQASTILAAGVSYASLSALSTCSSAASLPPPAGMPPPPSVMPPPPVTCPVSTTQNFAAAVVPCANIANACTTCITALATPFILAGVAQSNSAALGACVTAQIGAILGAGVNAASLNALSSCAAASAPPPMPPPPPASSSPPSPPVGMASLCPIKFSLDFTSAVTPCARAATACSACLRALAGPVLAAGVSYGNGSAIQACFQTHSLEMLSVGVPLATLAAMSSCNVSDYVMPAPPPMLLSIAAPPGATRNGTAPPSVLAFSGARRAGSSAGRLAIAAALLLL